MIKALGSSCSSTRLHGLRIGVPFNIPDLMDIHPARHKAFANALRLLERAGADIVQGVEVLGAEVFHHLKAAEKNIVLDTDLKLAIDKYLSNLDTNPQNLRNLRDLIDFTKSHPKEEYPHRNVAVLERALTTRPDDELYNRMLPKYANFSGEGGIAGTLRRYRLNILLVPNLSPTLNTFAAQAGSPCISLPMGMYAADTEVALDPGSGLVSVAPGIP